MHHDKDNKQKQGDQRQMNQERDRDAKGQRNEEETGKPVQLDKDGKENQGGQQHQGGGQHQQGGQQRPQERKPDQGQPTHFLTGRQWGVFTFKAPANFANQTASR